MSMPTLHCELQCNVNDNSSVATDARRRTGLPPGQRRDPSVKHTPVLVPATGMRTS